MKNKKEHIKQKTGMYIGKISLLTNIGIISFLVSPLQIFKLLFFTKHFSKTKVDVSCNLGCLITVVAKLSKFIFNC